VQILCGDFEETLNFADNNTLFYFDPPYKPISKTSNFGAYTENKFDDKEQVRLRDFCVHLDSLGHKWILSN
jgi:DNA adenine methylase